MGKDCSRQSYCISSIHGDHTQDAYTDVGGRVSTAGALGDAGAITERRLSANYVLKTKSNVTALH